MNYEQLKLELEKSNSPNLTYSERDAVLDLIERLTRANKALKAEVQRLLKERNESISNKRRVSISAVSELIQRKPGGAGDNRDGN